MSVIESLVTDREQEDVSRSAYLKDRVMNGTATTLEIGEWMTALKGNYNVTDWNRVGTASAYIYNVFQTYGYSVPGYVALRTDFTIEDLPDASYWTDYIATVAALKAVWPTMQEIPETMERLGVDGANNIEKALIEIDALQTLLQMSFIYSAEPYCGEF